MKAQTFSATPTPAEAVTPDFFFYQCKGQLFSPNQGKRDQNTDSLGEHRRDGGSRRSHMAACHEKKVTGDIADAGDGYGDKGRHRIPDAPEDAPNQVIGDNHQYPQAADPDIGHSSGKCFRRTLHDRSENTRSSGNQNRQDRADEAEHPDTRTNDTAAFIPIALTDLLAEEHRHAHGKTADESGNGLHQLRAGGNGRYIRGGGEFTHHQQVHGAIHGLQEQGKKHRHRETQQGSENRALCKVMIL